MLKAGLHYCSLIPKLWSQKRWSWKLWFLKTLITETSGKLCQFVCVKPSFEVHNVPLKSNFSTCRSNNWPTFFVFTTWCHDVFSNYSNSPSNWKPLQCDEVWLLCKMRSERWRRGVRLPSSMSSGLHASVRFKRQDVWKRLWATTGQLQTFTVD